MAEHDVLADLERRLHRVEAVQEIQQLFVDYINHLDRGEFEALAELFARDGELLLGPAGRAKGPADIQAMMERTFTRPAAEAAPSACHIVSSPTVVVDGDTATSEVMWTVLNRGEGATMTVGLVGRHLDDLVREDGRWRFKRRRGVLDFPPSLPA
jgi:uncharacterized protein (TIGR02246 family)